MQVQFPSVARDLFSRVNFQCRLSYSVHTPFCAVACFDICAHVKDPVVHVRFLGIMETLKHPVCTLDWVAQLCRSWLPLWEATKIFHLKQIPDMKFLFGSLQFSSVSSPIGSSGGHEERFSRDPLSVFSADGPWKQFWHGQGCLLFDVVLPAFPLLTMVLPTLQDALKDGFEEAVMVH